MNKIELKEFQTKQLILLDEIDSVAKKLKIKYYLIGGTLLGAVRHKGFIPWDVDCDIAFIRNDYEKILEYYQKNSSKQFTLSTLNNKGHRSPHAILYANDTLLIIKGQEKQKQMFLDIFPLDFPPKNEENQKKQAKKLKLLKTILGLKQAIRFETNSNFKFLLKKTVSLLLAPISYKFVLKQIDYTIKKYNEVDDNYLVSMCSHYSYEKQKMLKSIYGNAKRIKFENKEYYAPEQADKYLKKIYGDYMEIPDCANLFADSEKITFIDYRKL